MLRCRAGFKPLKFLRGVFYYYIVLGAVLFVFFAGLRLILARTSKKTNNTPSSNSKRS